MTPLTASALTWADVYLARFKAAARSLFSERVPRAWGASRHAGAAIGARLTAVAAVIGDLFATVARAARNARQLRLFAIELAGVVLVAYGISWWSVPAAVIIGGLVLVAAVEVRPHVASAMPSLPVPEPLIRVQAEQAARLINNARYGVPEVDSGAMDKLSRRECEQIITVARSLTQVQQ